MKKILSIIALVVLLVPTFLTAATTTRPWYLQTLTGLFTPSPDATSIAIPFLGSTGDPCLTVGTTGTIATSTCGGEPTPAGSSTQIQFNDSGAFGATTSLTFATSTSLLTVSGSDALTSPKIDITQASTGDAAMRFGLGSTRSYAVGIDNSDSDSFKISTAASSSAELGTTDRLTLTSGGIATILNGTTVTTNGQPSLLLQSNYSGGTVGSGPTLDFQNNTPLVLGRIGSGLETGADYGLRFWTYNTGLSEKMRLTGAGNLGIGTTTPAYKLSIVGNNGLQVSGRSNLIEGNLAANGRTALRINDTGAGANEQRYLLALSALGTDLFNFTNNGRLGIGTTTPTSALHIHRATDSTSQLAHLQGSHPGVIHTIERASGGVAFPLTTINAKNTTTGLSSMFGEIGAYGTLQSGTTSPIGEWMYIGFDPTTTYLDNAMRVYPSKVVNFQGNVGIGTVTPTHPLTVSGIANVTNALYMGTGTGSSMGDDNLVRPLSTNAFLNLKGGTGASKISIGNSILNLVSGSDSIVFRTAATTATSSGTEVMRITQGGNVGIGTTTPSAKLQITNTGTGASFLVEDTTSPDTTPFIIDANGNVGIGTTTTTYKVNISGAADNVFSLIGTGSSAGDLIANIGSAIGTIFSVRGDGKVGIGTVSPSRQFTIHGGAGAALFQLTTNDSGTTGDDGFQFFLQNSTNDVYLEQQENANMFFRTNAATRMTIDNTGNVGIGNTSPSTKLSVSGTSAAKLQLGGGTSQNGMLFDAVGGGDAFYVYTGSGGYGIYNNTDDRQDITIDNSGNVGIGYTSPSTKLNVNGLTESTMFRGTGVAVTGASGPAIEMGWDGTQAFFQGYDRTANARVPVGVAGTDFYIGTGAAATKRFVITETGEIGIATTTPNNELTVDGDVDISGNVSIGATSSSFPLTVSSDTSNAKIILTGGADQNGVFFDAADGGKEFYLFNGADGFSLYNNTDNRYDFTVNNSGNIGIATTTPAEKLHVDGFIRGNYKSEDGTAGFSGSGTSCTITEIKNGIITGASCI